MDGVGILRRCGFEALSVNRKTLFQKAVIKGRCYNKPYRSISVRSVSSFPNGRTSIPPRFAKAVRALCEARAEMSRHSGVLRRCRSVQRACRPLRRLRGYSPRIIGKAIKSLLIFNRQCLIMEAVKIWRRMKSQGMTHVIPN